MNIPDSGTEVAVDNTIQTATFLAPSYDWVVTNTGANSFVVNFDAGAAPTRTQPVGDSERFLPVGASVKVPTGCAAFTFQDAVDGALSKMLVSKG